MGRGIRVPFAVVGVFVIAVSASGIAAAGDPTIDDHRLYFNEDEYQATTAGIADAVLQVAERKLGQSALGGGGQGRVRRAGAAALNEPLRLNTPYVDSPVLRGKISESGQRQVLVVRLL